MPDTQSDTTQNSEQNVQQPIEQNIVTPTQNPDKLSEIADFYQDKTESQSSASSQTTAEPIVELSPFECYLEAFRKYATFSGRARRMEYWYFYLFNLLAYMALAIFAGSIPGGEGIVGLYILASIIPGFAVAVRRLHDTGKSGWFLLVGAIPLIGILFLLIFMVADSTPGANKYGPNPKGIQG